MLGDQQGKLTETARAWLNTPINNGMSECNHCNGEQVFSEVARSLPRQIQRILTANSHRHGQAGGIGSWSDSVWSSSARMLAWVRPI